MSERPEKGYNWPNFLLGSGIGYLIAAILGKGSEKLEIGKLRLHHYLVPFLALFTDSEFLHGLLVGAGLEDLPDLLDDLDDHEITHQLSDKIRKFQGKSSHWGF